MRQFLISVGLFLLISRQLHTQEFSHTIPIESKEFWWMGVIADSHLFPISSSGKYQFDFLGNTAGNQGQPLLLSNQGRYIWNAHPFKFSIQHGVIQVQSSNSNFKIGKAGTSLKEAYQYCSRHFFPPSGNLPGKKLFTHPQFNTWIEFTYNQNQEEILEYANAIVRNGFSPGVLMIDEGWFKDYGDWTFDPVRFPDPMAMMKELKDLGFIVMLWICPYYSPDGPFWKEQWLKYRKGDRIWIADDTNPEFPAVMQWWDGFSNVIDLSNPKGQAWFKKQLEVLVDSFGIDGFKFDGGDAIHYSESRFLTKSRSFKRNITPNEHSEFFVRQGLDYPYNEYRAAWKMGGQPIAMRLRDKRHNWEDLQKLIPGILNQGLMGYPFNCPDLIGGGEYLSFIDLDKIDQELVVRAAQCHALMPMMQFSVAPWRILSEENLKICQEMADLHDKMGREIWDLAKKSAHSGEPIVRPLDYTFPDQGFATIKDQFLLGEDILVAPVLEKGARSRQIAFPSGKWEGEDGSIVEGPITLEVKASLERLPWYKNVSSAE